MTEAEIDAEIRELKAKSDRACAGWQAGGDAAGTYLTIFEGLERRIATLRKERAQAVMGISVEEPGNGAQSPHHHANGAERAASASIDSERIGLIEKRIGELEARPEPKYLGVWRHSQPYMPGNMVTDRGALWHCNEQTFARPGSSGKSGWTLAVKSGAVPKERSP